MKYRCNVSNNCSLSNAKTDRSDFNPYAIIFESELRFMAGLAAEWGRIETGGELYGLLSHGGRPVIYYATRPGPKAIHQTAHFQADVEYLRRNNASLREKFGLQIVGNHHSHHGLGLRELSFGDIQSNRSTAQKNYYKRLVQFVLTFETIPYRTFFSRNRQGHPQKREHIENSDYRATAKYESSDWRSLSARRTEHKNFGGNGHPEFVQVNSFFYFNAMKDEPVKCPLKVLPGISPIRQAINLDPVSSANWRTQNFPTSRILFERLEDSPQPDEPETALPERIAKQCLALPKDVLNSLSWSINDNIFVLNLPLPDGTSTVYIAYAGDFPHRLKAVYIGRDQDDIQLSDVTNETLLCGSYTRLTTIYNRLLRHIQQYKSHRHEIWPEKDWGVNLNLKTTDENRTSLQ